MCVDTGCLYFYVWFQGRCLFMCVYLWVRQPHLVVCGCTCIQVNSVRVYMMIKQDWTFVNQFRELGHSSKKGYRWKCISLGVLLDQFYMWISILYKTVNLTKMFQMDQQNWWLKISLSSIFFISVFQCKLYTMLKKNPNAYPDIYWPWFQTYNCTFSWICTVQSVKSNIYPHLSSKVKLLLTV